MNENFDGTQDVVRHEYPKTVSAIVGKTEIYKTAIRATNAALEYKRNGREGEVPRFLLMTTTGSGKTWQTLEKLRDVLKSDPTFRVAFLTTSIKDSEERKADAIEIGIPENLLTVGRGRSQPTPDSTPENSQNMCRKSGLADLLTALNIEVGTKICRGKDKHGREVECEYAATCPYLAQMLEVKERKGGIVFLSHQYLSVKADGFGEFDLVVIDENPTQALYSTKRVDLGRFQTWRTMGDGFKRRMEESTAAFEARKADEIIAFGDGIDAFREVTEKCAAEHRHPRIEDFRAVGFDAGKAKHLATLEYTRIPDVDIDPGMAEALQWTRVEKEKVREAFGLARVWRCMETDFERADEGLPHSFEVRYGDLDKDGSLRNNLVCKWYRTPNFGDTPTLILDASAPVGLYKKFWPGLQITRVDIEYKNVRTTQTYDWGGSMQSLKTQSNQDDFYNFALLQQMRLAEEIDGRPERQVVNISSKAFTEALRPDMEAAGMRYMWFGNTRGKNEAKFAAAVNVFGRILMNARDLQDMACALYADDPIPLLLIAPDDNGNIVSPKRKVAMTDKTGFTVIVEVPYHPDPRIDELLQMVSYGEQDQAVGRFRGIYREADNPCELNIMSPLPLSYQPDRFVRKSQLIPTRAELMFYAGYIGETARLNVRLYPHMFKTEGAFRTAACRHAAEERAYPVFAGCYIALYNNKIASRNTWARATFTLSDSGNRTEKLALRVSPGERKSDVVSRLLAVLPDATDIDLLLPAPEVSESAQERAKSVSSTTPQIDPVTGIRFISKQMLGLAIVTAGDELIWPLFRTPRKYFRERKPANTNYIASTFKASA